MSGAAVAYSDPGRVGLYNVRTAGVGPVDAAAVFGAGAIGQMTAQIARLAGGREVVVSEPIDRRREAAREHGADLVVDPVVPVERTDGGIRLVEERPEESIKLGVDYDG